MCLFRSQLVCPYKLKILTNFIAKNVFSFLRTHWEQNRHNYEQFQTFKFDKLELGGGSNQKITNIIDEQWPKPVDTHLMLLLQSL